MTTGTEKDRERLGVLVRTAREERGLTHTGAAEASREGGRRGIQRKAWIAVEAGRPARPMTYRAIEFVLEVEPRACDAVLAGAETLTPKLRITEATSSAGIMTLIASVENIDEVSLRAVKRVVEDELKRRAEVAPPSQSNVQ